MELVMKQLAPPSLCSSEYDTKVKDDDGTKASQLL
jgi:hypothetical protein